MDDERITAMLDKTFAWSVSRTFSREEAEELTQEILFQAVRSVGELRDEKKFEPWFWRLAEITWNVFKRGQAKRRNTMSFNELMAWAVEDERDVEVEEEYQHLRRRIAQLSAAYRDILVMHYYDELSCKAISQKLGLPEGTVTYRLSLARSKLQDRSHPMNETALKPAQLQIRMIGEGDYNGDDRPFPWQHIDDALSQNILWHAYREPKTVEELSRLTGVPAFFIEDRIENLIQREAVIQPTKATIQTDFFIFDEKAGRYTAEHSGRYVAAVSKPFYPLARQLTETVLSRHGVQTAGRSFDEMFCLLSVMLLDELVPEYKPVDYLQRLPRRYDGNRWEYMGIRQDVSASGNGIGTSMGIEKSMNDYASGKLAHSVYMFSPFEYRRVMRAQEIDVCHAVLRKEPLDDKQKEHAAKLLAEGHFAKNPSGDVVCAIPVFTREQHDQFIASARSIFADFLPVYARQVKEYLDGYTTLFPRHLKEAAGRYGFCILVVAVFQAMVVADWAKREKITIPNGAICDVLVMM